MGVHAKLLPRHNGRPPWPLASPTRAVHSLGVRLARNMFSATTLPNLLMRKRPSSLRETCHLLVVFATVAAAGGASELLLDERLLGALGESARTVVLQERSPLFPPSDEEEPARSEDDPRSLAAAGRFFAATLS